MIVKKKKKKVVINDGYFMTSILKNMVSIQSCFEKIIYSNNFGIYLMMKVRRVNDEEIYDQERMYYNLKH